MQTFRPRFLVFALAFVLLAIPLAPVARADANENPGIIPNVALPHGSTYGDWSGAWWNWLGNTLLDINPAFDTTGEFCGVNQSGSVWFMGGAIGTVVRDCEIPAGKTIFYVPRNTVWWVPDCADLDDCRAVAKDFMDLIDVMEMEIDGVPVENPWQYRAQGTFWLPIVEGGLINAWGYPVGEVEAVTDGWYLMLAPLSVGQHTIHSKACFTIWNDCEDVTYHLTVVPGS